MIFELCGLVIYQGVIVPSIFSHSERMLFTYVFKKLIILKEIAIKYINICELSTCPVLMPIAISHLATERIFYLFFFKSHVNFRVFWDFSDSNAGIKSKFQRSPLFRANVAHLENFDRQGLSGIMFWLIETTLRKY